MTLCYLIRGSTILIAASNGAITSVVMHTLDRFWRIVYPIHHRKHYRRWMLYVGLIVPWINGFGTNLLTQVGTTSIINGKCYLTISWTPTTTKVRLLWSAIQVCIGYPKSHCSTQIVWEWECTRCSSGTKMQMEIKSVFLLLYIEQLSCGHEQTINYAVNSVIQATLFKFDAMYAVCSCRV